MKQIHTDPKTMGMHQKHGHKLWKKLIFTSIRITISTMLKSMEIPNSFTITYHRSNQFITEKPYPLVI